MEWDRRVPEIAKMQRELPNALEEHVAESRWQTCNCRTCQEKRMTMDAMPGKRIDWERYKQSTNWNYKAIFYVGGEVSE
jgi:hypothetical protein